MQFRNELKYFVSPTSVIRPARAMSEPIIVLPRSELEQLLIRAARLGASEFREELSRKPDRPMSKAEVAKYLCKSPGTINRYMKTLGLPFERHGENGYPRFYKDEVDKWRRSIKDSTVNV